MNVKLASILTGFKIDISAENVLGVQGFKSTIQEKIKQKMKNISDSKVFIKEQFKTKEDFEEEEDIHSLEVEQMIKNFDR